MNRIMGSLEETLTAINAELERTPIANKARCKQLDSMARRVQKLWMEAHKMGIN